jgi:hypothetical protein
MAEQIDLWAIEQSFPGLPVIARGHSFRPPNRRVGIEVRTRATLGEGLAVSAFPLYVPVSFLHSPQLG